MKKVRKKGQKRCNRYGYIASFKNCPLEHSAKAWAVFRCVNLYGYNLFLFSFGKARCFICTAPCVFYE